MRIIELKVSATDRNCSTLESVLNGLHSVLGYKELSYYTDTAEDGSAYVSITLMQRDEVFGA